MWYQTYREFLDGRAKNGTNGAIDFKEEINKEQMIKLSVERPEVFIELQARFYKDIYEYKPYTEEDKQQEEQQEQKERDEHGVIECLLGHIFSVRHPC